MKHLSLRFILLVSTLTTLALAAHCQDSLGRADDTVSYPSGSTTEFLPIVTYDTDVGFGYGAKIFGLNHLRHDESLDLVLFNSTKGVRWYRLVFSIPDFELRQGKFYPWAMDLTIEYDKWISNNFFGVGNASNYEDMETYTREPLFVSLTMSRGFSPVVVGQFGMRYRTVRNYGFSANSRLAVLPPDLNTSRATVATVCATLRYDGRDSYINPTRGLVLQAEAEYGPKTALSNVAMSRLGTWLQYYTTILAPGIVLAERVGIQGLLGESLPVQMLLSIGGNNTVRGLVSDRYLDRVAAVANLELRFPLFWRFGGVAGFDAGKVWGRLSQFDLERWATNPVAGLRFYMDTFVVRLDVGFGTETTGFYLNFGHLF
jgi:outer membrane protein assembly factor BamA